MCKGNSNNQLFLDAMNGGSSKLSSYYIFILIIVVILETKTLTSLT